MEESNSFQSKDIQSPKLQRSGFLFWTMVSRFLVKTYLVLLAGGVEGLIVPRECLQFGQEETGGKGHTDTRESSGKLPSTQSLQCCVNLVLIPLCLITYCIISNQPSLCRTAKLQCHSCLATEPPGPRGTFQINNTFQMQKCSVSRYITFVDLTLSISI